METIAETETTTSNGSMGARLDAYDDERIAWLHGELVKAVDVLLDAEAEVAKAAGRRQRAHDQLARTRECLAHATGAKGGRR